MTRRAVIIGVGGVTAFGENWQDASTRLLAYENAVRKMPEWQVHDGLYTLLGVPVDDFTLPEYYTRKHIRAVDRMSQMSTRANELALEQAGLIGDPILTSDETGTAYGSSIGSASPISEFVTMLTEKHTNNIAGITYVQMIPHITVVNTNFFFGLRKRVIPTSSACTSGSQVISYAWEAIRCDYQTVIVVGGAGELYPSEAAIFDTFFATSQHNDTSKTTPSPFGENRDGPVIGEDAGTLIFEELEHAKARSVTIYGEIAGFATSCDAAHITQPQCEAMQYCMEQSLKITGLSAQDIGYISAHGTATDRGDMIESLTAAAIYGDNVSLSSLKNYFGHMPGAYGALEAWMSLQMMCEGRFAPTLNLNKPDPNCGMLDCIMHEAREVGCESLQGSNFAFGGINISIITKRWP